MKARTILLLILAVTVANNAAKAADLFALQNLERKYLATFYCVQDPTGIPGDAKGVDRDLAPFKIRLIGVALLDPDGQPAISLPWGSSHSFVTVPWAEIESFVIDFVKKQIPPPSVEQHEVDASGRLAQMLGTFPGTIVGNFSSDDIKSLGSITAILYKMAPNQITIVAMGFAQGLALIDNLSGGSGVQIFGNPLIGVTLVCPRNPEDFLRNVGTICAPQLAAELGRDATALLGKIGNGIDLKTFGNQVIPMTLFGRVDFGKALSGVASFNVNTVVLTPDSKAIQQQIQRSYDDAKGAMNQVLAPLGIKL